MIFTIILNVPQRGIVHIPVVLKDNLDCDEQVEEYVEHVRSMNPEIKCEGYFPSPELEKFNK